MKKSNKLFIHFLKKGTNKLLFHSLITAGHDIIENITCCNIYAKHIIIVYFWLTHYNLFNI